MTDLELATLEGNELHPFYELLCREIDGRAAGKGRGNVEREIEQEDAWFDNCVAYPYSDLDAEHDLLDAAAHRHISGVDDGAFEWMDLEMNKPFYA